MKKLALVGFMFLSFAVSAAEGDSTRTEETWSFANAEKRIKFSPLEIFNSVPTIGADLDVSYKDGIRFQAGFGLVPSFLQPSTGRLIEERFNWMGGYKLRGESKFFVLKKPNRYFSLELSMRHLIIRDEIAIGMEGDGNGNFAYFQDELMTFNRFNTQIAFKYGFEKTWESGFLIDFYAGLAIRQNYVISGSKIPEGGVPQGNWNVMGWDLRDGYKFNYPTPILGFRLGYILK